MNKLNMRIPLLILGITPLLFGGFTTEKVNAQTTNGNENQTLSEKTIYEMNERRSVQSSRSTDGITFEVNVLNEEDEFIIKKNNKEIYRGKGTSNFTDKHFESDILKNELVGKWTKVSNKPTTASNVVATVYGDKVYNAGGWWQDDKGELEVYDPATNKWRSLSPMSSPRYDLSLVAVREKLYAIGGRTYIGGITDKNEAYDIKENKWLKKSPIPIARDGAGAVEIDGKIYVIGGFSKENLKRVDIYDPSTDSWTQGADMPKGKSAFGIAVLNEKIYIIGGRGGMKSVEQYDPKTDTWKTVSDLNNARFQNGAQEYNGRIYTISGQAKEGNYEKGINSVEVYVPEIDKWFELSEDIIEPRSRFGMAKTSKGLLMTAGWAPFATNSTVLYKPSKELPIATYEVEFLTKAEQTNYQFTYFLDGYRDKVKDVIVKPTIPSLASVPSKKSVPNTPSIPGSNTLDSLFGKISVVKPDEVWAVSFSKEMNNHYLKNKGVYVQNQYEKMIPAEWTIKDNTITVRPTHTKKSEVYTLFVEYERYGWRIVEKVKLR